MLDARLGYYVPGSKGLMTLVLRNIFHILPYFLTYYVFYDTSFKEFIDEIYKIDILRNRSWTKLLNIISII